MSKLTLNIPDYLSIESYTRVKSLEHLTDLEKMVATVAALSDVPAEKLRELQTVDIVTVFDDVTERLIDVNPEFYPMFEVEGQLYGYCPINKLTLGANIDLENLLKDVTGNLPEIMAILYRPILKHRFNSIKYAFKQSFKVGLGEVEDITKYYELEEYSPENRHKNAEVLKTIPVNFALGALSFFLQVGNSLLIGSQISSTTDFKKMSRKEQKKIAKETVQGISAHIGDGLKLFTTSRQLPSLRSQEIIVSQI